MRLNGNTDMKANRAMKTSLSNKLRILFSLPRELYAMLVCYLPGRIGRAVRYHYWKKRLRFLGQSVRIDTGVVFQHPEDISIGDRCWIDKDVVVMAGMDKSQREKIVVTNAQYPGEPGVVHIGKAVHVGIGCIISGISAGVYISDGGGLSPHCKVYAFTHHYRSKREPGKRVQANSQGPTERQCLMEGPIYLGRNTAVALNSVILPGVTVGDDSFVAINSVVMPGEYGPNEVLRGNPARRRSGRFRDYHCQEVPLGKQGN